MKWLQVLTVVGIIIFNGCSEEAEIIPSANRLSQSSFLLLDTIQLEGGSFNAFPGISVTLSKNNGEVLKLPTRIIDDRTLEFSVQDCCSPPEIFNGSWSVGLETATESWTTTLSIFRLQPAISSIQPREVHRSFKDAEATRILISGENFNKRFQNDIDLFQVRLKEPDNPQSYFTLTPQKVTENLIECSFQLSAPEKEFSSSLVQLYIAGQTVDYPIPLEGKGIAVLSVNAGQPGNFLLISSPVLSDQLVLQWNSSTQFSFKSRELRTSIDGDFHEYVFEVPDIGTGDYLLKLSDPVTSGEFILHPQALFRIQL